VPALRPVPFVCRVSCRGTANGTAVVNVFHAKFTGASMSLADTTALANAFKGAYETHFVPRMSTGWSGDTVRCVDLTSPDGEEATVALGGTSVGSGTSIPASAACCITWKINRHYRGGHPRTYIGALPNTAIESPTSLAAAYVSAVSTAANAFRTAINGFTTGTHTFSLVAVHRYVNLAELETPITSAITSAVVDTRIDSQRRRLGPDR
jgi:hypothetical protein